MELDNESPFAHVATWLEALKATPAGELWRRAEDLRKRLFRVAVAFVLLLASTFFYAKDVFLFFKRPLTAALPNSGAGLHFTDPLEVFMSYMRVGFLCSSVLVAPYFFSQVWRFVGPALPARQRHYVVRFFLASTALFYMGMGFCFYIILPTAMQVLLDMGSEVATPLITIEEYTSLAMMMMLGFGCAFQLPVIIVLLERLQVVNLKQLTEHRRLVFVLILIVAAAVTPTPDPFSQLAMAFPMYGMYELAILVIRNLHKQDPESSPHSKDLVKQ